MTQKFKYRFEIDNGSKGCTLIFSRRKKVRNVRKGQVLLLTPGEAAVYPMNYFTLLDVKKYNEAKKAEAMEVDEILEKIDADMEKEKVEALEEVKEVEEVEDVEEEIEEEDDDIEEDEEDDDDDIEEDPDKKLGDYEPLTEKELKKLSVDEIKEHLSQIGKSTKGTNKKVLINRYLKVFNG
jgi:ABC-type Zn2+ transport system substrate-binding protein/surface adhesin